MVLRHQHVPHLTLIRVVVVDAAGSRDHLWEDEACAPGRHGNHIPVAVMWTVAASHRIDFQRTVDHILLHREVGMARLYFVRDRNKPLPCNHSVPPLVVGEEVDTCFFEVLPPLRASCCVYAVEAQGVHVGGHPRNTVDDTDYSHFPSRGGNPGPLLLGHHTKTTVVGDYE